MQAAAEACLRSIEAHFCGNLTGKKAQVLCGQGNNGGDGAALAQELSRVGVCVDLVLFGTITNATGDDFVVGGTGTANITWNAPLSNSGAGNSVDVSGHTGGTVSFTGAITDTGQGINLNTNTGATLSFSGGMTLNGTSAVFTAQLRA